MEENEEAEGASPTKQAQQKAEKQFDDAVEKMGGAKKLLDMAKNVSITEITMWGAVKGTRNLAGSFAAMRKIQQKWAKGDKAIRGGDRQKAIELAKESRKLIEDLISKPGNTALIGVLAPMLADIDSRIKWMESGKPLEDYKPEQPSPEG
jgi:hypothetical protein